MKGIKMSMNFIPPSLAKINILENRATLEQFIELAIALLDAIDGDPDLECNGDIEGAHDEDEWSTILGATVRGEGPG